MNEPAELYTIGEVARRIGVPARTIRFWCDAGVLAPTDRSAGGYRRFDAAAVARLDLVRTLGDLGLGLDDIRELLRGRTTMAEIAGVHAAALDAQIRVLRLRRAVTDHARQAFADGLDPASAQAAEVLDRIAPPGEREGLAGQLETFTDERVERCWQLLGILNGRPPFPATVPAFRWLIAALRAQP